MAAALDDLRKSDVEVSAVFVGFDTSPKLIEGIQSGAIAALVSQDPKKMGYLAVETIVKQLKGESIDKEVDTGVELVTKERLENEAAIRELVGFERDCGQVTDRTALAKNVYFCSHEVRVISRTAMTHRESSERQPRLTMKGVTKNFGATRALRKVDLEVYPGEVLALVGENGAGKSTLMKVLSGAHQPNAGSMTLEGKPYRPRNPLAARAAGIGMIYQELSLAPHLSVMENILLGIEPTAGPFIRWSKVKQTAIDALKEIGLGSLDPTTPVNRLSIAHQQMVEIARAVALDCKVLVLDEPTSSLTQSDIRNLFELIRRLKAKGISIVYISHFLEEVEEISDRITVLRDGESVGSKTTSEVDANEIVAMMVGRDVDDLYPRSARDKHGEIILGVDQLTGMEFPERASIELRRGCVMGISGLVGAGTDGVPASHIWFGQNQKWFSQGWRDWKR